MYDTIQLGQRSAELYPYLTTVIKDSNALIESYKLTDKSVFSQISAMSSSVPVGDSNYRRELKNKEKKIKELEDKFKKLNQKKTSGGIPDGKPGQVKKPAPAKSSDQSAKAGPATPAQNLNEKPLTVEERDNLIKQISSLN